MNASDIDKKIVSSLAALRKPGVLTLRPGYEIKGHQLTGKSAIVATVHTKKKQLPASEALPDTVKGVPVDVREATPHQRLRAKDPTAAAIAQTYGRPEQAEPTWPYEREMPSGKPLAKKATPSHVALTAHAKKIELPYQPLANFPLDPVAGKMTITAHVSPDAGLDTLTKFLNSTQSSLVVGMYDFTSGPILKTFLGVLGSGNRTLQMVLDNPAPNPTRNQTDTQTVQALDAQLGARSNIVRALVQSDSFVDAWIFPYAYHIKVIVRDETAFWLSSGNLNNSNQPDLSNPPHTEDRDWHVIIENKPLAILFSAYIDSDFKAAASHQNAVSADVKAAVDDAHLKLVGETNPTPTLPINGAPTGAVRAKIFNDIDVTITPLLTPDTLPGKGTTGEYQSRILKLLQSAQKTLYIQLQYVESPPNDNDSGFKELLVAVLDRFKNKVDVRIIESLQYGEKWAEKMKSMPDVDLTEVIRLQPNVHNKGIVVDSKIVVVSSQNWSPAGVLQNRDAGVIIESADIAQYFESVFLSDWQSNAKPFGSKAIQAKASVSKASAHKTRAAKTGKTRKGSGGGGRQ